MESFEEILEAEKNWVFKMFGNDPTGPGHIAHIQEELVEAMAEEMGSHKQLLEWCDVIFLAFNAAIRSGFSIEDIRKGMKEKLTHNLTRRKFKVHHPDGRIETVYQHPPHESGQLSMCVMWNCRVCGKQFTSMPGYIKNRTCENCADEV